MISVFKYLLVAALGMSLVQNCPGWQESQSEPPPRFLADNDLPEYETTKQSSLDRRFASGKADQLDQSGMALIHVAATRGRTDLIAELIKRGVDISQADKTLQWTALHWAASRGQTETAKFLIDNGCDVNSTGKRGRTPLHLATTANDETIQLLLKSGAEVNAKDENGFTPLHQAARGGDQKIIARLIEAGSAVDAKAKSGITPVWIAKLRGDRFTEQALLQAGATVASNKPISWASLSPDKLLVSAPTQPDSNQPTDPASPTNLTGRTSTKPIIRPTKPVVQTWQPNDTEILKAMGMVVLPTTREALQVTGIRGAAAVVDVKDNSAADKNGFKRGDMITHLDGKEVLNDDELKRRIKALVQKGRTAVNVFSLRPSEGVSFRTDLPLPIYGYRYKSRDGAYSLPVPPGWYLLEKQRNVIDDPTFDSLVSPDRRQVLIISRQGYPVNNSIADLKEYEQQKLAEASRYSDVNSQPINIMSLPAFRVSYRLSQQQTAVSRVSFVLKNRRYVINVVSDGVNHTRLSKEVQNIFDSIGVADGKPQAAALMRPVVSTQQANSPAGVKPPPRVEPPPVTPPPIETGRPSIGVQVHNVAEPESKKLNVRAKWGCGCHENQPDFTSGEIWLALGDVIYGFDGQQIKDRDGFIQAMAGCQPGASYFVDILRDEKSFRFEIVVSKSPER